MEKNMLEEIEFIGTGDLGCRVAENLSNLYEEMSIELGNEGANGSPKLNLHTFPFDQNSHLAEEKLNIILVGSVDDPSWETARRILHDNIPYFMMTIGLLHETKNSRDMYPPYPNEIIIFPKPSLFSIVDIAHLALQIILIHTPWALNNKGSLIGYDFDDTRQIFAGKVAMVRSVISDKEHYRQNYTDFLTLNKEFLGRAKGVLLSFWGKEEVLPLSKWSELWDEMILLAVADADLNGTYHILPEDGPDFMATLFVAF